MDPHFHYRRTNAKRILHKYALFKSRHENSSSDTILEGKEAIVTPQRASSGFELVDGGELLDAVHKYMSSRHNSYNHGSSVHPGINCSVEVYSADTKVYQRRFDESARILYIIIY